MLHIVLRGKIPSVGSRTNLSKGGAGDHGGLRWRWFVIVGVYMGAVGFRGVIAGDWPQFHGPNRDNICSETALLREWPENGPKLLWTLEGLGRGYSTISIAKGRIYTMGDRRGGDGEHQFVIAYDLATRKELWATRIGPPHRDGGPRCTPTVDGDRVYAIGTDGDLVCLDAASGQVVWQKNFARDFEGRMMSGWRYSESPLVDGEKLVCTPGGPKALLVALNKLTGETIWRCTPGDLGPRGADGAGYASIIPAEIHGVRQYITIVGRGAVGVEAATGKLLWNYNRIANSVANIPNPVVRGEYVFVTTAYRTGCALLRIKRDGDRWTAEEVYFHDANTFANHHGGVVLVGDYLYGGDGQNRGAPTCIEFLTGKIMWKENPLDRGSAAVLYADGRLYFRYEGGTVALVAADPHKLRVISRFRPAVVDGPAWPHPVIHDGKLYLRAHNVLMCYDVKSAS